VNFGLMFPFRNSSSSRMPFPELYGKHFDLTVKAEELGYDTIWLTEEHGVICQGSYAVFPSQESGQQSAVSSQHGTEKRVLSPLSG